MSSKKKDKPVKPKTPDYGVLELKEIPVQFVLRRTSDVNGKQRVVMLGVALANFCEDDLERVITCAVRIRVLKARRVRDRKRFEGYRLDQLMLEALGEPSDNDKVWEDEKFETHPLADLL